MADLVVRDLHKHFAGVIALDSVSLTVKGGEIFSLVGPNGSGKTTLFNCVSGFNRPQRGEIHYNGTDLLSRAPHEIIRLGISRTFQNLQNVPYMTVLDNVLLGKHSKIGNRETVTRWFSRLQREREEASALEVLDFLGLANYEQKYLSGQPYGIQKLVEIARALVARPELILIDEPAAGMNDQETMEIAKIVSEIRDDLGITVLVVEHDMSLVMSISDRVCVLDSGNVLALGVPEKVKEHPDVIRVFWGKKLMLNLIGVETFYGKIKALHGVSLEVTDGQLVCILGANGAGKTTILKTISGIVEPEYGTIHFNGEQIDRMDAEEIVSLGICHVPEERRLFPELTVYDNLLMGGFLLKERDLLQTRLEEVYQHFPVLQDREKQLAGTLSGGEQQMVAISRALMLKPKLLLLDEPSLGLSPILVDDIFATIKTLHQSGVTILLVEQNVNHALRIADYGYVLTAGKIFLSGTYDELREEDKVREMYLGEGKYVRRSKLWGVT